jgi:hypothetical protein
MTLGTLLCKTSAVIFARKNWHAVRMVSPRDQVERRASAGGMSAMQNQCCAAVDGIFDFA